METSPEQSILESQKSNTELDTFAVKQQAQIELMEAYGGDEMAGKWIDAYSARLNELINSTEFNFIERLANKDTHNEALLEIREKLYH